MSRNEKLLTRLLNPCTTFTWPELVRLLGHLGYRQVEGSASRAKFDNNDLTRQALSEYLQRRA